MEKEKNIEAQSALTPPLKAVVVNGKKKIAVGGVVNLDIPEQTKQQQADWNQNDENAPDFIKNRICSENTSEVYYATQSQQPFDWPTEFIPVANETYYIETSGNYQPGGYSVIAQDTSNGIQLTVPNGAIFLYNAEGNAAGLGKTGAAVGNPNTFPAKLLSGDINTIADRFIPNTVARGAVRFKVEGTDLRVSLDGGVSWKTVTLT